jgi:hypothetical protein
VVHSIQNYSVYGLCPESEILNTRKQNVPETGLFRLSGERGGWEDAYSVGSLRNS